MLNIKSSLIILWCIFILQIIIYSIFFRPFILTWGASEDEVNMPLIGDDLAPYYSSTRAILINAPISEAWQSIISLGADRGGFFSYTFIEDLLGYDGQRTEKSTSEMYDMKVGRIVPGSLDYSKPTIKYTWPVLAVDPGRSFVLKNWGAFVLKEISPNQTRLIVRTHERELHDIGSKIGRFVMIFLHYQMERRMMIGFKAQFEPDAQPSDIEDMVWYAGLVLSFLGIIGLVFICRGIQSVLLPTTFGIFWLFVSLVFYPVPQFSITLLVIIMVIIGWLIYRNRQFTA